MYTGIIYTDVFPVYPIYTILSQQTISQFCVNYSLHHASFVQTIVVQFLHQGLFLASAEPLK